MQTISIVENSAELLKHTAAIHVSNALSVSARKVSNILLKNAFPKLMQQETFHISVKKILDSLGWLESKNYTNIADILKSLNTTQIEWNIFKKDKKNHWGITTILADAEIINGTCSYSYSPKLKQLLGQPNIYAKLNLVVQAKLKSKYSLVLWEFLVENLCSHNTNSVQAVIGILDIRKLLSVPTTRTYDDFKILNRDVISKAVKEINEVSDIEVTIRFIKDNGKKVNAVCFTSSKKAIESDYKINESIVQYHHNNAEITNIFEILKSDFGISDKAANSLIVKYEEEYICRTVNFIRKSFSFNKIKNKAAYLIKALEDEWASISELESENHSSINNKLSNEKLSNNHIAKFKGIEKEFLKQVYLNYGCDFYKSWMITCVNISYDIVYSEFIITVQNTFRKNWLFNNCANKFIDIIHDISDDNTSLVIQI